MTQERRAREQSTMSRSAASRLRLPTAVFALAVLFVIAMACRVPDVADSEPEPTATVAPEPSPTPEATNTGPGRIRTILETDCKLLDYGAEVSLSYRVNAVGANRLSRVQMTLNGAYALDTGAISQVNYTGDRVWRVAAGTKITVLLTAESAGNPATIARSRIECPEAPAPERV